MRHYDYEFRQTEPQSDIRLGTVIRFPAEMTREQAEDVLRELSENHGVMSSEGVREYDATYCGPVWYIP